MQARALLSTGAMLDPTARAALARIDAALARIDAVVARRPSPKDHDAPDQDVRYEALRARTQAALSSLETVIARVAAEEGPR